MNNERHLFVSSLTWNRDSNGLFDYECKENKYQEEKIKENTSILRKKMDIKMTKIGQGYSDDNDFLFDVRFEKEKGINF